jgi:WD40 repeat protein
VLSDFAFTPDSTRLLAGGWNGALHTIHLDALPSGRPRHQVKRAHTGAITRIAHLSEGGLIATASQDGHVRLWNDNDASLIHDFGGMGEVVADLVATGNQRSIAAINQYGTMRVWNAQDGALRWTVDIVTYGATDPNRGLALAGGPNHKLAAAAGSRVSILNAETGEREAEFDLGVDRARRIRFLDSQVLLIATESGRMIAWDTNPFRPTAPAQLAGHTDTVTDFAASSDGTLLFSGSADGTARVFRQWGDERVLASRLSSATFAREDRVVISSANGPNREHFVEVRNSTDARLIERIAFGQSSLVGLQPVRSGFAFESSPTEFTIASWSANQPPERLTAPHDMQLNWLSPDGAHLLAVRGEALVVQNLRTSARTELPDISLEYFRSPPRFTPRGDFAAVLGRDGRAHIVAMNGQRQQIGDANASFYLLRMSASGRLIATASDPGRVQIWRLSDRRLVGEFAAHQDAIWDISISPDDRRLATASSDLSAKIFSIDNGSLLSTLPEHSHFVRRVQLFDDALRAMTADENGDVRVWDTRSGRVLATYHSEPEYITLSADGTRMLRGPGLLDLLDTSTPFASAPELSRRICENLLAPQLRRFSQQEVESDPLLASEWSDSGRSLC